MTMYRQGDVLLRRVTALPKGTQRRTDSIVARGEATGHAHRVEGDAVVFVDPQSQALWVQVMSRATLTHQEHGPITLERGIYEVIGQDEYTAGDLRRVTD